MAEFASTASTLLPLAWDISKKAYNLVGNTDGGRFPGNPSRARKILVAGLAGSGKSSLINALTGMNLKTGDSAQGVTFNCSAVDERIYKKETTNEPVKMVFMDTVGFDAGAGGALADGALHRDAAFTNLMKLLRATSELDLIMYVMKKGRVSTADTACYELLVNKVAHGLRHSGGEIDRKIPVVLVITHCETTPSSNLQRWLGDKAGDVAIPGVTFVENCTNQQALGRAGMDTSTILCTAFFGPDHFANQVPACVECRTSSVRDLLSILVAKSDAGSFRARHDKPLLRQISVIKWLWSKNYRNASKDTFLMYLKGVFSKEEAEKIYSQVTAHY